MSTWNLIRSVPVLGDRRTFYEAETDLWTRVSRIAAGRKARELDPGRWYDQMIALPRSKIALLMKMGGGIARLLDRGGRDK